MAWLHRIRDYRNRRVADPAFRRWAARFPLTRFVARRQAKALFDLTAGFVYSQILAACVKVDLFTVLDERPASAEAIAARTGLSDDGALRLLKAAAAIDLVEARGGDLFALGPLGAALVGNDGVTAMIRHHAILYDDLRDPLALLGGKAQPQLQRYWAYAGGGSSTAPSARHRHSDYTALMGASQAFIADEILGAYPFASHRKLLDIGGGDASFILTAAKHAPQLELSVFDLPPVAAIARERILAAGLAGRARAFGGSFFDDPLPLGADLMTLNRVLHDHDDAAALAILKAARKAIAPDGTLLVAEPMAGTKGALASGDAYFGFYLLAMGQGRPRTEKEIAAMARRAGFSKARPLATATPMIARVLALTP